MNVRLNLVNFRLFAKNVPIPKGLFYPCLCLRCSPNLPKRPEPSVRALEEFIPPALNDMMELHTPLHCRTHCGGKEEVIVRTRSSQRTRYLRGLAFLYRTATFGHDDPDPAIHVRLYADRQQALYARWLPVPLSTFTPLLTDAHGMELSELSSRARFMHYRDDFPSRVASLFNTPLYETWHIPARLAAVTLANRIHEDPTFAPIAHAHATLASQPSAYDSADFWDRAYADRVAFNPYPMDHWPWAPGWAPTQRRPVDHTIPSGAYLIPADIRRWWNFKDNPTPWLY